jgi:hypothetical protein
MAAWHALWDAAEDHYFLNVAPPARFDAIIQMDDVEHSSIRTYG